MAEREDGKQCSGVVSDALKRSHETSMKLYFDKIIEVQSASFEHATKANTVNVTVIYAGSFLLLQSTAEQVPTQDWKIIVLLLFVSLVTFAIWTVSNSYRVSRQTIRYSKVMTDQNKAIDRKLAEFEVLDRQQAIATLRFMAAWGFVYLITLVTGFAGALYLLVFYVLSLLGVEFSLHDYISGWISQASA